MILAANLSTGMDINASTTTGSQLDSEWLAGPVSQAELIQDIADVKKIMYTSVVGATILIYDYLLTLDLETVFIWPSRLSTIKVLYLLTRYFPFMDSAVTITYHFIPGIRIPTCHAIFLVNSCFYVTGMGISEIILAVRTYAVWQRDRTVGIGLMFFFLTACALAYYSTVRYLESIRFIPSPAGAPSCVMITSNSFVMYNWILLMALEGGVTALMLIKTYKNYRPKGRGANTDKGLIMEIAKEGIAYYISLFILSLLNVGIIATQPSQLDLLFTLPVRIIHSVLTARLVLQLRVHASQHAVLLGGSTDCSLHGNTHIRGGDTHTHSGGTRAHSRNTRGCTRTHWQGIVPTITFAPAEEMCDSLAELGPVDTSESRYREGGSVDENPSRE
ncbi:hypothetical protein BJ138DRAFT_1142785 [Hygrophoropsis aurantiaca]|uniref:Uncharacterized protein n=1 Tax=Hygrophoropsis aurantiaca TaxID=72124 RepID=A0ACB8APC0_9AGAM|nr:hypothetical protein BJ138DRAFT_1142785 [Hygrophoropsis aurantiaca]